MELYTIIDSECIVRLPADFLWHSIVSIMCQWVRQRETPVYTLRLRQFRHLMPLLMHFQCNGICWVVWIWNSEMIVDCSIETIALAAQLSIDQELTVKLDYVIPTVKQKINACFGRINLQTSPNLKRLNGKPIQWLLITAYNKAL